METLIDQHRAPQPQILRCFIKLARNPPAGGGCRRALCGDAMYDFGCYYALVNYSRAVERLCRSVTIIGNVSKNLVKKIEQHKTSMTQHTVCVTNGDGGSALGWSPWKLAPNTVQPILHYGLHKIRLQSSSSCHFPSFSAHTLYILIHTVWHKITLVFVQLRCGLIYFSSYSGLGRSA